MAEKGKKVACYLRVSTTGQNERGQRLEIERWLAGHGIEAANVLWFVDKATGDNLARPAFEKLQAAAFAGEVSTIVVYKLDRISRSLADGINTLVAWCKAGIRVVATSQQLDFSGATGQLVAAVLFAVAQMEQETRRERQAAGIAAAKAAGKSWGGSQPNSWRKLTAAKRRTIERMRNDNEPITAIAEAVGVSRPAIYTYLKSLATV